MEKKSNNLIQNELIKWMNLPKNQKNGKVKPEKKIFYEKLSEFKFPESFNEIDEDWYSYFVLFLEKQNYAKNYIDKFTKELISFMNYSYLKKIHQETGYKTIKRKKETINHPYLNPEELKKIHNVKNLSEKLENTRIIFFLMYYSGARFCDAIEFKKENIQNKILVFKVKKNNKNHKIPANPYIVKNISKKKNF